MTVAEKHSSYVNSMDWSTDSKWLRSTASDRNTYYFDIENKCEDGRGHEQDSWST